MSESVDRTDGGIICMRCGKVIKHECNLKRHFMIAHSGDDRRYLCPFCQREYKNRHSFGNHVYSTHPEYKGLSIDKYAVDNNQ